MRFIALLIYFFSAYAAANPVIIQKPILFNNQRIELTREYRKQHYGINQQSITIVPQMIVLHWTNLKSFQKSFDIFYPPALEGRADLLSAGNLNVSVQFLVDREGHIYQLMPSNWMGRHVVGLNNIAIGIENAGGEKDQPDLTDAQLRANIALIRQLVRQYPTIHYLIGHYEYLRFKGSSLWGEKDPSYFTTNKLDPGVVFMREVREQVADLKLKSDPP